MTPENPPKVTRIYLVRHGTADGADGIAVGQIDLPLADSGRRDLDQLATTWATEPPDVLLSSDLARAAESADRLAQAWGMDVLERDPRLREMNFGDWDGRTWDELQDLPDGVFRSWMKKWWTDPAPGGEALGDVAARATDWLDDTLERYAGQTVVAVAHGGSIRTLIAHVLQMPGPQVFHLRLDHGNVSLLETTWRGLEVAFTNADRFPPLA